MAEILLEDGLKPVFPGSVAEDGRTVLPCRHMEWKPDDNRRYSNLDIRHPSNSVTWLAEDRREFHPLS